MYARNTGVYNGRCCGTKYSVLVLCATDGAYTVVLGTLMQRKELRNE